jgi:hypothetical protein
MGTFGSLALAFRSSLFTLRFSPEDCRRFPAVLDAREKCLTVLTKQQSECPDSGEKRMANSE